MIDTHAHLNFRDFEPDLIDVINRAKGVGVSKFIVPSSNLDDSQKAIGLSRRYPEIFAAVGFHPINAQEVSLETIEEFSALLLEPKVVAVGETGLDYFYLNKTPYSGHYPEKEAQRLVFIQILELAREADLPLIFHCRQAYQEMLTILKKEKLPKSGVVHCFMGSIEQARDFLDLNLYLSFAGNITYSNTMDEVIRFVPLERLMLETDAPYLAPAPYRSKRNEPCFMIETARKIADLKGIGLAELVEKTDRNAEQFFGLK